MSFRRMVPNRWVRLAMVAAASLTLAIMAYADMVQASYTCFAPDGSGPYTTTATIDSTCEYDQSCNCSSFLGQWSCSIQLYENGCQGGACYWKDGNYVCDTLED